MSRRWWWVIIVVLCGTLLFAVAWARRGPVYQGKSLRVWLRGFDDETSQDCLQSAEAVRHMGPGVVVPKAVSLLSKAPPGPEPGWKRWIRDWVSRQSNGRITVFRRVDQRCEALAALDALGPEAKAAIPDLERLLHDTPPDHQALVVLARIGLDAVPALNRAITNDVRVIRMGARICLDAVQSRSDLVFPKTPQDAEFRRRVCKFNLLMVQAAFREYAAQHPLEVLPDRFDSRPPPQLPPGFVAPEVSPTNNRPVPLPPPLPGL